MVLMNYHELTMNEPRDSPARRKQFMVICTVMMSVFCYSTIMAGLFHKINITEANFPGGTFVYKSAKRDYAAAPSLELQIAQDLGISAKNKDMDKEQEQQLTEKLYTIYLDHPGVVSGGRNQRFASGFLADNTAGQDKQLKSRLLDMNQNIQPPTRQEVLDLPATKLWERLRYKEKSLPKAKSAVVNFPFTNGFVSALILSWKVIPALRKHAQQQQQKSGQKKEAAAVTVITTCSIPDQMCTHYSPLEKADPFLLGQPRMEDYVATLPKTSVLEYVKTVVGLGGISRDSSGNDNEL